MSKELLTYALGRGFATVTVLVDEVTDKTLTVKSAGKVFKLKAVKALNGITAGNKIRYKLVDNKLVLDKILSAIKPVKKPVVKKASVKVTIVKAKTKAKKVKPRGVVAGLKALDETPAKGKRVSRKSVKK